MGPRETIGHFDPGGQPPLAPPWRPGRWGWVGAEPETQPRGLPWPQSGAGAGWAGKGRSHICRDRLQGSGPAAEQSRAHAGCVGKHTGEGIRAPF